REPEDGAGLREVPREERGVKVAPGLNGLERLERDAGDHRVPGGAAAERDPPNADLRVAHLGPRGEPVELRAHVGDLSRPVEGDEAARRAVTTRVRDEDGVPLLAERPGERQE